MSEGQTRLAVGEKAPDFTADTWDGKNVTLSERVKQGPVVLVFIRGFG
jgi:peroxiredoxin